MAIAGGFCYRLDMRIVMTSNFWFERVGDLGKLIVMRQQLDVLIFTIFVVRLFLGFTKIKLGSLP